MSEVIDDKIVSLTLDQENFERNVERALQSLDELKEGLKFEGLTNSLSSLGKIIEPSLNSVGKTVDYIASRFSFLGMTITDIKKKIIDFSFNAIKSLTRQSWGQILTGGRKRAENLEQARFQLQGLLKDAKEVEKIMGAGGPVQNAVKGTAFGLDEAARVSSQLVASNLRDTDKLEKALTAISGVAAMTNEEYSNIGSIFTTVAGQGKLMTQQLRQFEGRGLNVAADIAKAMNTSEEAVRKMVSKGEIDFETFYTTMFDAYAEHAKAANDTYAGSLSNLKAAFSRIGADVFTVYLEKMRNVFNALRPLIDNVHVALKPLLDLINRGITASSERVVNWLNKINKGLENLLAPIKKAKEAADTAKKAVKDFSYVEEMAWKVIRGDYGNGQARINALREAGYSYEAIQNRVKDRKSVV